MTACGHAVWAAFKIALPKLHQRSTRGRHRLTCRPFPVFCVEPAQGRGLAALQASGLTARVFGAFFLEALTPPEWPDGHPFRILLCLRVGPLLCL